MMDQEKKMRAVIAIGTTLLVAAAWFATRDAAKMPDKSGNAAGDAVKSQGTVAISEKAVSPTVKATPRSAIVTLRSASDAGEYGTASLLDLGNNRTRITIVMANAPKGSVQPANIHGGGCKDLSKEPQYALKPVVNGRSVTELTVGMGALIDQTVQSIRVRTDAVTAGAPYAACGDLR